MKHLAQFLFILMVGTLVSCKNDGAGNFQVKPMALGRMNEIVVLADEDLWSSAVKDTFEYYFESAYPIMPTPEPLFDTRHFTLEDLQVERMRKELRTYMVLADLSDANSPITQMVRKDLGEERFLKAKNETSLSTTVGKDKWAKNQIVIYVFGDGRKELMENISKNFSGIAKRVKLHDKNQLDASIYSGKGKAEGYSNLLLKKYGIQFKVPGTYQTALEADEANKLTWLRRDDKTASINIVFQEFPYTSPSQLSKDSLIALRDRYGKEFVSSDAEDSYMVTNSEDLPVYDYTYDIDGNYTRELRGIWELENDYMGGPFATYAILRENEGRFLFIDVFVNAPGQGKRNFMMKTEHMVKNITFANKQ